MIERKALSLKPQTLETIPAATSHRILLNSQLNSKNSQLAVGSQIAECS